MCDMGVSAYLAIASLAVTAAAGYYSADASKKTAAYEGQVADLNAKRDEARADQRLQIGAIEEANQRAKVRSMVGSQRATLAANGIDVGSGTAIDLIGDTQAQGESDALTIRFNAMNDAWGLRDAANQERDNGRAAKWKGKVQAQGTYLSTAGSLLSQGSSAYGSGAFAKKPATTNSATAGASTAMTYAGRP